MNIKVDKRVPMGFRGIWARCYKNYNFNQITSSFKYEDVDYYDTGFDVQIKLLTEDKKTNNVTPIENLVTRSEFRIAETSDAYFNGYDYMSVVQPNDILYFQGHYWVCDKVDERGIYTPQKQGFYYLHLRKIFNNVIVDNFSKECIVQVVPTANGNVTLNPLKEFYVKGEEVQVIITPNEGYEVDTISGVALDTENKFTAENDVLITVTFREV